MIAFLIIYSAKFHYLQFTLCFVTSIGIVSYYVYFKPHTDPVMNKMDIFNETSFQLLVGFMITFTFLDFQPDIKYEIGWITILLYLANFLTNVVMIIII
jgi:hypothetical protein